MLSLINDVFPEVGEESSGMWAVGLPCLLKGIGKSLWFKYLSAMNSR